MRETKIWTTENVRTLRELYPTMTAGDIADIIGCSDCTVSLKAKELGLKKDKSFKTNNFYGRYTGTQHGQRTRNLKEQSRFRT